MRTSRVTAAEAARFFDSVCEYSLLVMVAFFAVSKAVIEITCTTAFISWLLSRLLRRDLGSFPKGPALWFLAGYVALSLSSVFVSEYLSNSLRGIVKHLQNVTLFLAVLNTFSDRERMRRLVIVGIMALLVTLLDALWQYGTGKDLLRGISYYYTDTNIRLVGSFGRHGLFAGYLIAWLSFLIAFLLEPAKLAAKEKILLFLTLCLGGFCLFQTQARGGWLSFAVALAFFSLIQGRKILLAGLAGVIVAAFVVLPRNMIVHVDAEGKEQSMVERYVLWDRAAQVIKARPWLGTGLNTYSRAHQQFDKNKNWRVQNYYAHNSFLQLAAERGVPALGLFLLFLGSFYARSIRVMRALDDLDLRALLKGVLTGLTGLFAFAMVDTIFEPLQTGLLIWLLLGMGFAALVIAERRNVT